MVPRSNDTKERTGDRSRGRGTRLGVILAVWVLLPFGLPSGAGADDTTVSEWEYSYCSDHNPSLRVEWMGSRGIDYGNTWEDLVYDSPASGPTASGTWRCHVEDMSTDLTFIFWAWSGDAADSDSTRELASCSGGVRLSPDDHVPMAQGRTEISGNLCYVSFDRLWLDPGRTYYFDASMRTLWDWELPDEAYAYTDAFPFSAGMYMPTSEGLRQYNSATGYSQQVCFEPVPGLSCSPVL